MKRFEKYEVNVDRFADLMSRHYLDSGVDTPRLYLMAVRGEDIRPLAIEFITDRLKQCVEAWECAAGVWRLGGDGRPERDYDKWDWDEFQKELGRILDRGFVL